MLELVVPSKKLIELDLNDWNEVIDINLKRCISLFKGSIKIYAWKTARKVTVTIIILLLIYPLYTNLYLSQNQFLMQYQKEE